MGGSTTTHSTSSAANTMATIRATTPAHASSGATSAMIAKGRKQHRNETAIQMASLMRQTLLMRGFSWLAGISRIAESFLVRAELFSRPFFQATPHKPPNSDGLAKAATFSRPYYPTFRLRDETLGILKEEKCA